MTRDIELTLITPVMAADAYGIPQESTPQRRTVMARVESVTRSEFFDAGRNGLNPEYKFTMFQYDYQGEKIVEYNGRQYTVYRTYMGRSDTIELYVEQRGETNG